MDQRETVGRRDTREGGAPVRQESLGGGTNPRKEQTYRSLQHTAGTNWTRRWNKPLKSAAGLWKRIGGDAGAEVTERMFEASEPGPRSIEDRVLRERTDSDVGGPRRSTHPESSVVGETPATQPPARGATGAGEPCFDEPPRRNPRWRRPPGRSNPDREVRSRACAEAGAGVHIASEVAPKGRPAREIDPHRPDDPWVPGNRYRGPPSGLRRNGVRFTARDGRPRSERPPPRKRVGGRERAGTCHPWTSVRAGEPRSLRETGVTEGGTAGGER